MINKLINTNYDRLYLTAKYITKNDTAGDLLHLVLESVWKRNEPSLFETNTKFCNYVITAMHNQYNSKTSPYYTNTRLLIDDMFYDFDREWYDFLEFYDVVDEYEGLFVSIIQWVEQQDLYEGEEEITNHPIKNLLSKKFFIEYYYAEKNINIEGLTTDELKQLRNQSLRNISKKYNVSEVMIYYYIKHVINKIKEKYII